MYKVLAGLSNDSTGGNGHDTIHGFKVGNLVKDSDADLLDMSELLDYKVLSPSSKTKENWSWITPPRRT